MDIKAYIESGIIESYVLGLADEQEAAGLEMLCRQHPEIRAALNAFEAQMEAQAFNNAIAPPPELKGRLMDMLADEFEEEDKEEKPMATVIPISDEQLPVKPAGTFWKYFAAASVILLVGSAALNLYLYNNYNDTSAKYLALLIERNTLLADNSAIRASYDTLVKNNDIIKSPDFLKVTMPGVKSRENNFAVVYWDPKTKDVYYLPAKMDKAPEGKQYQLWAIVDGKPVDAGLVEDCNGLCKMKNIPNAQAFAITLEDKGGSPSPNLEAMYVAGAVKG